MALSVSLVSRKGRGKHMSLPVKAGRYVCCLCFCSKCTKVMVVRTSVSTVLSLCMYVCAPLFLKNSLCCGLISLRYGQRLGMSGSASMSAVSSVCVCVHLCCRNYVYCMLLSETKECQVVLVSAVSFHRVCSLSCTLPRLPPSTLRVLRIQATRHLNSRL